MKLNIIEIPKSVACGENKLMNDAVYLMHRVQLDRKDSTKPSLENIIKVFLTQNNYTFTDILKGLYNFSLYLRYQGSQGVVGNLQGILDSPTWEEAKSILEQWKFAESATYMVVPD